MILIILAISLCMTIIEKTRESLTETLTKALIPHQMNPGNTIKSCITQGLTSCTVKPDI
mgnify:CR=1 FL=1